MKIILDIDEVNCNFIRSVEVTDVPLPEETGSCHDLYSDVMDEQKRVQYMTVREMVQEYISWHQANQKANKN